MRFQEQAGERSETGESPTSVLGKVASMNHFASELIHNVDTIAAIDHVVQSANVFVRVTNTSMAYALANRILLIRSMKVDLEFVQINCCDTERIFPRLIVWRNRFLFWVYALWWNPGGQFLFTCDSVWSWWRRCVGGAN